MEWVSGTFYEEKINNIRMKVIVKIDCIWKYFINDLKHSEVHQFEL